MFKFPYAPYKIQESFMKSLYNIVDEKMFGILESPTGTGKSMSIICGICKWIMDQKSRNIDNQVIPKVIYATRTHSQIEQFVNEFRKSPHFGSINVAFAASRKHLCLNSEVCNIKDSIELTYECKRRTSKNIQNDARCVYNISTDLGIFNLPSSELKAYGRENKFCPYYACVKNLKNADIQLLPYDYVLVNRNSSKLKLDITDSIIIFDEAHNFLSQIDALNRCRISMSDISDTLKFLKFYSMYNSLILDVEVSEFISSLNNIFNYVYYEKDEVKISTGDFKKLIDMSVLNIEISDGRRSINELLHSQCAPDYIWDIFINGFNNVCEMILCIGALSNENIVHIGAPTTRENCKRTLSVIPIQRIDVLYPIVSKVHSLILTGGTILPVDEVLDIFETCNIPRSRVHVQSYDHVIKSSQILSLPVSKGINGALFDFRFGARKNEQMILELGEIFINLFEIIPDGTVIFFTSYRYLNDVIELWNKSGLLNSMKKVKQVFIDHGIRSVGVYKMYIDHVNRGNAGSFFSVFNGRSSEGINFSDKLLRSVFIVGMPYKNPYDPFNATIQVNTENMAGKEYSLDVYKSDCMKIVNQAIGRCVRHNNDYSSVVLFDHRYSKVSTIEYLPKWVQRSTMQCNSYDEMLYQMRSFYKINEEEFGNRKEIQI